MGAAVRRRAPVAQLANNVIYCAEFKSEHDCQCAHALKIGLCACVATKKIISISLNIGFFMCYFRARLNNLRDFPAY
jgi:hypothetical protein